jgi:exopolysaccharide production protein ExoQ
MRKIAQLLAVPYLAATVGINVSSTEAWGSIIRLMGLLVGFFWVLSLIQGRRIRKPDAFVWFTLAFVAVNYLSYFWSIAPDVTLSTSWRFIPILMMVLVLYDLFRTRQEVENGMVAFLLGCVAIQAQVFYNYFTNNPYYENRYGGFIIHPNTVGYTNMFGVLIAWILITEGKHILWWVRPFLIAFPLFAVTAIVLSGSRGSLVAAFPFAIYLIVVFLRRPVALAMTALLFAAAVPYLSTVPVVQKNVDRIVNFAENSKTDRLSNRTIVWDASVEIIRRHPILGAGGSTYRVAAEQIGITIKNDYGGATGAHQTYLEVASELGIPGIVTFFGGFIAVWVAVWRAPRNIRIPWLCALFAMSIVFTFDMMEWRYVYWAVVILAVCSAKMVEVAQPATAREPQGVPGSGRARTAPA